MKKLIIVLMVAAMASFLFVGCLPTTPETPVTPVTPVTPTVKTDTPIITSIDDVSFISTSTQYTADIVVDGIGVTGAFIKLYVDGVYVGIGTTGNTGVFEDLKVTLAKITEGVKKIYVTATAPGLAESDKSTEYTVTYDATKPKLASIVADSSDAGITVTFSEDVNMNLSTTATTFAKSALNYANWKVNGTALTSSDIITRVSDKVVKISKGITAGTFYYVGCTGVYDLAGNYISIESVATAIGMP